MLIPLSFRPRALVAAVVLAGVLLAPLASHGCDARGTSPEDDAAASAAVAVTHDAQTLTIRLTATGKQYR